jgi:hypothetical protein
MISCLSGAIRFGVKPFWRYTVWPVQSFMWGWLSPKTIILIGGCADFLASDIAPIWTNQSGHSSLDK